jgi:hypothetical protein
MSSRPPPGGSLAERFCCHGQAARPTQSTDRGIVPAARKAGLNGEGVATLTTHDLRRTLSKSISFNIACAGAAWASVQECPLSSQYFG